MPITRSSSTRASGRRFPFYSTHSSLRPPPLSPHTHTRHTLTHPPAVSLVLRLPAVPPKSTHRNDVYVVFHIITHNIQNMLFFPAAFYPCVLKMKRKIGKSTCASHSARDGDIFPCGSGLRTLSHTHTRIRTLTLTQRHTLPRKLWRAFVSFMDVISGARSGHWREIFILFLFLCVLPLVQLSSAFVSFATFRWHFLSSWPMMPPHRHHSHSLTHTQKRPFFKNLQIIIIIIRIFFELELFDAMDGRTGEQACEQMERCAI